MKALGWVRAPLKGGDLFTLDLGDRFLVAFPQLMTLPDKRLVDTGGGVGLPELSRVAAAIGGRLSFPTFRPGEQGTDFNDMASLRRRVAA